MASSEAEHTNTEIPAAPVAARASPASIRDAYQHLYHSGQSLVKLKDAALGGRLFDIDDAAPGVAGRSLAWKIFLTPPEPLQPPEDLPPQLSAYLEALRAGRVEYARLLLEKMRAPDGSYEDGFIVPGTDAPPPKKGGASNLDRNNPLSLHDENPWNEWFESVELRKTIQQDVERTFPDIAYFREPAVQSQLSNILYLYSVMHPAIGYRQGMHELLAPLYYAIDYDSLPADDVPEVDSALKELCARRWIAADAWMLFDHVMRSTSRWYEWREDEPLPGPAGQVVEPKVAPIIVACNQIQHEMLRRVDPTLDARLQTEGIEPQIFGIRWLRLLFTREFAMRDAMMLWDGLFAVDASLDIALWLAVAMLLRIRNRLIPADYSEQITYLLRYPTSPVSSGTHHITLLLRQALALQMAPTPSTGASITVENRNILNIPIEVPEPPQRSSRGGRQGRRQTVSTDEPGHGRPLPFGQAHTMGRAGGNQYNLPDIAKNLYDRGEALGINKTIFNAVSELKRNLPDIAANFNAARSPNAASAGYGAFPLVDDRPSPPWEPRPRSEIEREIATVRATQRRLGESMNWIVDTLLLDESTCSTDTTKSLALAKKKREALEALAYVRDVLNGAVPGGEIDEERLTSEEEIKARKAKAKALRAEKARRSLHTPSASLSAIPSPPPQVHSPSQSTARPIEKDISPPVTASIPAPASTTQAPARPTVQTRASVSPQRTTPAHNREPPWNNPRPMIPSPIPSTPGPQPTITPLSGTGTRPSPGVIAPWNYTPSDFAGKSSFGASVQTSLAQPPRAQAAARSVVGSAGKAGSSGYPPKSPNSVVQHDPLGALP